MVKELGLIRERLKNYFTTWRELFQCGLASTVVLETWRGSIFSEVTRDMKAVNRGRCSSLGDSVSRVPIVNIEVEADKEDHGDQEADEGEEDELL